MMFSDLFPALIPTVLEKSERA